MNILDMIAEQKILSAMNRGDFDNLDGSGKPFQWKDDSLVPEDQKLAFELLQKNGFSLPWIEMGNELQTEIHQFRESIKVWLAENSPDAQSGMLPADLSNRLVEINKKIMDYNRSVPVEALQVSFIDIDRELNRIRKHI